MPDDDDPRRPLPPDVPSAAGATIPEQVRLLVLSVNRHGRLLAQLVTDVATLEADRNFLIGSPVRRGDIGAIGRIEEDQKATKAAADRAADEVERLRAEWARRDTRSARRQNALIGSILVAGVPAIVDLVAHFAGH